MFDRQHPNPILAVLAAGLLLAALLPVAAAEAQLFEGGAAARAEFDANVYPIVQQNCQRCHGGSGPGFPHIAHVDAATAFRAVFDNQKVNLSNPGASRLVRRLNPETHYCWGNCAANATEMRNAIQAWADATIIVGADPNRTGGELAADMIGSVPSDVSEAEPVVVKRLKRGIVAKYEFDEGGGTTAYDSSTAFPAMHLAVTGGHTWLSGGGLEFQGGRAMATEEASLKLWNYIASGRGSHAYSIEAWLVPANTSQDGPARIITYAGGTNDRNFMLGQNLYTYVFRNRNMSASIDDNGNPALVTDDGDEDLQARLQHVVINYRAGRGREVWVDGVHTDDPDPLPRRQARGRLINWARDHRFAIGNETSNNREWMGQFRRLVIYNRPLKQRQILKNYLAGVAQRFKMRFLLTDYLGAGSYIEFDYNDFDAYSYLFCNPTLVSRRREVPVEGVRLAVNSVVPVNSQAFADVSTVATNRDRLVSRQCTVLPKDLGPDNDRFAVAFEVLGDDTNLLVEAQPAPLPVDISPEVLPTNGIRRFAQVRDTMSEILGIPTSTAPIPERYTELTQQLPETNDLRSFVSSQQVAISKLALEYCDLLVETPAFRTNFFGAGFNFGAPGATAFDATGRSQILTPLVSASVGLNLNNQPDAAAVEGVLDQLITDLVAPCSAPGGCAADRTQTVVKATCAAALSSAAAQLH